MEENGTRNDSGNGVDNWFAWALGLAAGTA